MFSILGDIFGSLRERILGGWDGRCNLLYISGIYLYHQPDNNP